MHRLFPTGPLLLALGAGLAVGCNEASSPQASTSSKSAAPAKPQGAGEYILTVEGMV